MLNCRQCLSSLCDYLDGELNSGVRAEFDEHLGKCRKCLILCQTTQLTVRLCRDMCTARVPEEVESRLMAVLHTRMVARRR
ncbi:MAG TPA: zf-HC2 domain-containing protein [Bryobacteraceae bacterium]|nr:zf-HC2 domain-containing protein [Bryobacteraceae bacterium]